MGIGNTVIVLSEGFMVTDKVKILPNKGYGVITKISVSGFIFLDHKDARPYLPTQLKKIKDIPKIPQKEKVKKQKGFWHRFWFERPNPLADERESVKAFLIAWVIAAGLAFLLTFIILGIVFLFLSI